MRILYNATSAKVGGGLSYSRSQLSAMARADRLEVTVLTSPWNHLQLVEQLPDSLHFKRLEFANVGRRFIWEQVRLRTLADDFDVLISPGNFATYFSPIPQVLILQNPNYVGAGRKLPRNKAISRRAKIWLSHVSMRRVALVVSISNSLTSEIAKEPRLSGINLTTVRSGAPAISASDPHVVAAADSAAMKLVGSEPYLLSVANDYPHKRLDDLARLAPDLQADDGTKQLRVVFAGDLAEGRRDELRRIAGSAAGRLIFLGSVTDPQVVRALYRGARATVITSELEAWPLTLHEASSEGSPLILTDIPPHRELADDVGRFFKVGDVEGLSALIKGVKALPAGQRIHFERSWDEHVAELQVELHRLLNR